MKWKFFKKTLKWFRRRRGRKALARLERSLEYFMEHVEHFLDVSPFIGYQLTSTELKELALTARAHASKLITNGYEERAAQESVQKIVLIMADKWAKWNQGLATHNYQDYIDRSLETLYRNSIAAGEKSSFDYAALCAGFDLTGIGMRVP